MFQIGIAQSGQQPGHFIWGFAACRLASSGQTRSQSRSHVAQHAGHFNLEIGTVILAESAEITFFGQGLAKGFGLANGTLAKGILAHSGFSGSVRHIDFAKKDFHSIYQ